MSSLLWLSHSRRADEFPPVSQALTEPNGLLAAGGDLEPERLLAAYRQGIFPWYQEGQPILWWSPDPRAVLWPSGFRVSRSLRRKLTKRAFEFRVDTEFEQVVAGCAEPRRYGGGTWITPEMAAAYSRLHRLGWAHSFETWAGGRLVGGLYGVAIGHVFFGESMFTRVTDASKVALAHAVDVLRARGTEVIDCQVASAHTQSLGAVDIPRTRFVSLIRELCADCAPPRTWRLA
jgi:leucyl/phenylalanyl-tRNA--protein transferase